MALTYVGDHSKKGGSQQQSGSGRRESKSSGGQQRRSMHRRVGDRKGPAQGGGMAAHGPASTATAAAPAPLSRSRNLTMKDRPSGRIEPLGRSSLRSKGSSSNSSDKQGRIKSLKNCCRKTVEFMFTQVGVGAVVVFYTLMGASIFQYLETLEEDPSLSRVEEYRNDTVRNLWNLTNHYNVLNKARWKTEISRALYEHEREMVRFVQEEHYDQRSNEERWTFSAALMFALSVITMIGYGSVVPRTDNGKITCIVYACIGIPVYILYFMNMGKVFAAVLKWVYTKAYRWNVRRKWKQSVNYDAMNSGDDAELDEAYLDELEQQVIVPSTTCLWVMIFYLIVGTIMFAEWEHWDYLDSVYFCVTSLCKIGFGDFVPGSHERMMLAEANLVGSAGGGGGGGVGGVEEGEEGEGSEDGGIVGHMVHFKLVITFVYLLVGMGVVAMCYYLLKEEVTVRARQMKDRMRERFLKLKVRLGLSPPSVLLGAELS